MRIFLLSLAILVVLIAIYDAMVIARALLRGSEVAANSDPYERPLAEFEKALLVVGDSTAVGTGASEATDSIAGRIATDFPALRIDNLASNGALSAAVDEQLRRAPLEHYDMVLIQVGGNDALRFTGTETLRAAIEEAVSLATDLGEHVALMSSGDLGAAPALPWPMSRLFSWRSHIVRKVFSRTAAQSKARYVDLFVDAEADNPFLAEPDRYHARDGLHPSSAGYGAWYETLREQLPLSDWLDRGAPR